jgi:hypothetical protein
VLATGEAALAGRYASTTPPLDPGCDGADLIVSCRSHPGPTIASVINLDCGRRHVAAVLDGIAIVGTVA